MDVNKHLRFLWDNLQNTSTWILSLYLGYFLRIVISLLVIHADYELNNKKLTAFYNNDYIIFNDY